MDELGEHFLTENGVGQVQSFLNKFEIENGKFKILDNKRTFTIATGKLAYTIFKKEVIPYLNEINNLTVNLIEIKNDFYGHMVTVAGLITGQDIIAQLKDKDLGEAVWCSNRILNDEGTLH